MKNLLIASAVLAAALIGVRPAVADVIVSLAPGMSFEQNSGVQTIGVYMVSASGNAEVFDFTGFFTLNGATVPAVAGQVNQAGWVASTGAGWSKVDSNTAGLDIELGSGTTGYFVPDALVQFAALNIDTTGMSLGNYTIDVTPLTTTLRSNPAYVAPSSIGSFSVTASAVPEPGTMAVLGLVGGAAAWRRRRAAKLAVAA